MVDLKAFLIRANQRQSKAKKCKFVVLLGRSLTLSGIEKTSTR